MEDNKLIFFDITSSYNIFYVNSFAISYPNISGTLGI